MEMTDDLSKLVLVGGYVVESARSAGVRRRHRQRCSYGSGIYDVEYFNIVCQYVDTPIAELSINAF